MKTDAADLIASEIQLLEPRQRREMLEPDVADLREADVERLQLRQFGHIRQAGICDVSAAQIQRPQLTVPSQKRNRRVGDEFRRRQVQLFELIERLQPLDAAIGRISQRQIEAPHRFDRGNSLDVRIGRPGASQRDVDDVSGPIADDGSAGGLDRCGDAG